MRPRTSSIMVRRFPEMKTLSALDDRDFEVFARNDHGAVFSAIHPGNERKQVVSQSLLVRGVERRKGLEHWAVVVPEDVEEMLGRTVAKVEIEPRGLDRDGRRSE